MVANDDFDERARACAAAFADGDAAEGERRFGELLSGPLSDDMDRWLRWFVFDGGLYDDVYARAQVRIYRSFANGVPILRGFLRRQYKWAAADVAVKEKRHRDNTAAMPDDDAAVEAIMRRAAASVGDDPADAAARSEWLVSLRRRLDDIERHFRNELGKERWADVFACWRAGELGSGEIERRLGIRATRARQLKMDISSYLMGPGRHLLEGLREAEVPA